MGRTNAPTETIQKISKLALGFVTSFSRKAGLPPGSLVRPSEPTQGAVATFCIRFDATSFEEVIDPEPETVRGNSAGVTWFHIQGLHDIGLVETIGASFDLHDLALEDVLHGGQRPKIEEYARSIFVTLSDVTIAAGDGLAAQQVSLFFSQGLVLSFSERPCKAIETVRQRLRRPQARARKLRGDYLAYALLDAVLDTSFQTLDSLSERVTLLEDSMVGGAREGSLISRLHELRGQVLFLRRMVQPLREVARALLRSESEIIAESSGPFLQDWQDHCLAAFDSVDTLRVLLAEMLEIHLASMSIRMNQKMKALTVMAGTFVPLTFIAGLYGMNFKNMPELNHPNGYFIVLGVMTGIALTLLFYFHRRKWF